MMVPSPLKIFYKPRGPLPWETSATRLSPFLLLFPRQRSENEAYIEFLNIAMALLHWWMNTLCFKKVDEHNYFDIFQSVILSCKPCKEFYATSYINNYNNQNKYNRIKVQRKEECYPTPLYIQTSICNCIITCYFYNT